MKNITKYDALKIKAVFLYVLNKMGSVNLLSALKIIYFANKNHLARYGCPLIEDDFIAMPKGPVPSFLYDAIKCAKGESFLHRHHDDILQGSFLQKGYDLVPTINVDMDELSESDIYCLDLSLKENGRLSASELTYKSHQDSAWVRGKENSVRLMDNIRIAIDAGASKEMIRLIQEHEDFDNICN